MFVTLQLILVALYVAVPLLAIAYAAYARVRHQRVWPTASLLFSFMAGTAVGVSILMLNRWLVGGTLGAMEYARAIYLSIAALCVLKFLDYWLLRGLFKVARVPLDELGRPKWPNQTKALLVLFVQRLSMLVVILAYSFALLMSYRPRVVVTGTPADAKPPMTYARVEFRSTDGVPLAGWWAPAGKMPGLLDLEVANHWGKRTVLLCHGVGAGKEKLVELAKALTTNGFNVFLFDFRGHGESGANFISYGDRERHDVLGAAKWIKANHLPASERLFGIGMNTGAAALIGAAADEEHGPLLDGLVLYEPFADFRVTADSAAARTLPPTVRWLVKSVSLPLAGWHGGSDFNEYAPAKSLDRIWPRPILVVHGRGETFVPNTQSMEVFQRASYPKEQFWPADNYQERLQRQRERTRDGESSALLEIFREYIGTSDLLSSDPGVMARTLRFLNEAEAAPVI